MSKTLDIYKQQHKKTLKKWREEGCPNIFKINIDLESKKITKEIAFQKLNRIMK